MMSGVLAPATKWETLSFPEETLKRMGFVWGWGVDNYINFWVYLV